MRARQQAQLIDGLAGADPHRPFQFCAWRAACAYWAPPSPCEDRAKQLASSASWIALHRTWTRSMMVTDLVAEQVDRHPGRPRRAPRARGGAPAQSEGISRAPVSASSDVDDLVQAKVDRPRKRRVDDQEARDLQRRADRPTASADTPRRHPPSAAGSASGTGRPARSRAGRRDGRSGIWPPGACAVFSARSRKRPIRRKCHGASWRIA